jgi:flagellar basal body-associated protein FliL
MLQLSMRELLGRRPTRGSTATLWIILVALLWVVAAACGGGSTNSAQSTTTSTSAKSTGQNVEADKAAAQAASLQLSDFPAGWTDL